jgi:pimeloyl-ACP methyl ester carboxylesterase
VLPGIMGSHLWIKNRKDRVWFDPPDLALGGLDKIGWPGPDVTAEKLFDMFYGNLCRHLLLTHRVERFAYDWRQPLDRLADDFAKRVESELGSTTQPVRIIAHSMGGLVVRALIAKRPDLWDDVMKRKGARLVMLGTPNQGSHSMVATLLGKGDSIRMLARVDQRHDLQGVLDIVAQFRGALQLLPKPGFLDTGKAQVADYFEAVVWKDFKAGMSDAWFGDNIAAVPDQTWLDEGKWLWKEPAATLPDKYKDRTVYVFGSADNTACGVKQVNGHWKLVGTPRGDGTVTWLSGRIEGIGRFYNMPAEHGALADSSTFLRWSICWNAATRSGWARTNPCCAGGPRLRPSPMTPARCHIPPATNWPVALSVRVPAGASRHGRCPYSRSRARRWTCVSRRGPLWSGTTNRIRSPEPKH